MFVPYWRAPLADAQPTSLINLPYKLTIDGERKQQKQTNEATYVKKYEKHKKLRQRQTSG